MNARFLLAAVACLAASCGHIEVTTTQYVGVTRFKAVEPEAVRILSAEPAQRHERLGEILLEISADPAPPIEDVERRLQEEAAPWGASAVYVIRDIVVPGAGRKLVGIAIRYRQ